MLFKDYFLFIFFRCYVTMGMCWVPQCGHFSEVNKIYRRLEIEENNKSVSRKVLFFQQAHPVKVV